MADRVAKLMRDKGITQTALAVELGTSQPTISRLLKGEVRDPKIIEDLAEFFGVSAGWVRYGDESNVTMIDAEVKDWDNGTPTPDTMVKIPFFKDMSLSAGKGALNSDIPYSGAVLWFSKSFIRRKGACLEKVFCVTVQGDSMHPRYEEGSVVVIDSTNSIDPTLFESLAPEDRAEETTSRIIDGKAYAITYNGQDYIKRLRRLSPSRILITSDNPIYPAEEADASNVLIIGRVIAYQREE